jgi:TPR repeat protein
MRWYRRAVKYDGASAAYNIATIYRERADARGEVRWLRKAAKLGASDAKIDLARIALASRTSSDARRRTIANLQLLARSRDPWRGDALLLLADAYDRGWGVPQSSKTAQRLRKQAAT